MIKDKNTPLDEKIEKLISIGEISVPEQTLSAWAKAFLNLEIMSYEWRELLNKALQYDTPLDFKGCEAEFEKLCIYFLYRYVANEKYEEKIGAVIGFCVLCSRIIATLWQIFAKNEEERIEICRLFSQEIEYSEENVESIIDMIEEYNEK